MKIAMFEKREPKKPEDHRTTVQLGVPGGLGGFRGDSLGVLEGLEGLWRDSGGQQPKSGGGREGKSQRVAGVVGRQQSEKV